jgi:hypothetical protein
VKHAAADQDYIGNCFRKVTLWEFCEFKCFLDTPDSIQIHIFVQTLNFFLEITLISSCFPNRDLPEN